MIFWKKVSEIFNFKFQNQKKFKFEFEIEIENLKKYFKKYFVF
jgi:hypothetical protein